MSPRPWGLFWFWTFNSNESKTAQNPHFHFYRPNGWRVVTRNHHTILTFHSHRPRLSAASTSQGHKNDLSGVCFREEDVPVVHCRVLRNKVGNVPPVCSAWCSRARDETDVCYPGRKYIKVNPRLFHWWTRWPSAKVLQSLNGASLKDHVIFIHHALPLQLFVQPYFSGEHLVLITYCKNIHFAFSSLTLLNGL